MKRSTPIFLIVGTFVAAFLGVIGGTEFIEWRQQRHYDQKVEGLAAGESTLFRKGQKFPKIELVGLDGTLTDTHSLNTGKHSLYLFLSVGCDPCTEAIQSWIKFDGQIPDNVEIFG